MERYGVTDQVLNPSLNEYFDVDILCEILSRVPVKSLDLSCKFVCTRWLSLIRSPHFVESQRIQSQTRRPSLIIRTKSWREQITKLFLVDDGSFEDNRSLPVMNFAENPIRICSSGYLLCLIDREKHSVRICNPFTGEITPSIGSIEHKDMFSQKATYGFGFDLSTKKHKVVRVWEIEFYTMENNWTRRAVVCEVLTVGEDDTWRKIDEVPPCISDQTTVSLNGSIYWMKGSAPSGANYEALVAFDMAKEKFREIPILTSLPDTTRIKLLEVDGCIAMLHRVSHFEVKLWTFKDDENWIEEIISMPFDYDRAKLFLSVQHIPGTDIIIFKAKGTKDAPKHIISIYRYDTKKKTFDKVDIIIGLPAEMPTALAKRSCIHVYGFFRLFESLYPVRKQQCTSND